MESGSAVLINLLQNYDSEYHPLGIIVTNCRSMLQYFASVHVKHVHRERNMVADLLAKNSTLNAQGICYLYEPPAIVSEALLDDIVGVARYCEQCLRFRKAQASATERHSFSFQRCLLSTLSSIESQTTWIMELTPSKKVNLFISNKFRIMQIDLSKTLGITVYT
ncbi:hypothetical protein ACLB2K_063329 [Fragaria x ananassa]